MNIKKWFNVAQNKNASGEVTARVEIYDVIGGYFSEPTSVLLKQISAIPKGATVTVSINSPGGHYLDGLAIYNALLPLQPRVEVLAEACSAASIVAMAGKTIVMPENAWMMIHNITLWAEMTVDDMDATTQLLKRMNEQAVNIYVQRTGKSVEEITQMCSAETWFTGTDALAAGFCDEVSTPLLLAACNLNSAPGFRNPPPAFIQAVAESERRNQKLADSKPPTEIKAVDTPVAQAPTAPKVEIININELRDLFTCANIKPSDQSLQSLIELNPTAEQARTIIAGMQNLTAPIPSPVASPAKAENKGINFTNIYNQRSQQNG